MLNNENKNFSCELWFILIQFMGSHIAQLGVIPILDQISDEVMSSILTPDTALVSKPQDRKFMCSITLRSICATTVAVEKQ